jgi:hypothetical protein
MGHPTEISEATRDIVAHPECVLVDFSIALVRAQ